MTAQKKTTPPPATGATTNPDPWKTTRWVLEYTGMSKSTLHRRMHDANDPFPHSYIGARDGQRRGLRFRKSRVDAWLARREGGDGEV